MFNLLCLYLKFTAAAAQYLYAWSDHASTVLGLRIFLNNRSTYGSTVYRSGSAGPHGSRNVKFDQSGCEFIRNNQSGSELNRESNRDRDVAAEPELLISKSLRRVLQALTVHVT